MTMIKKIEDSLQNFEDSFISRRFLPVASLLLIICFLMSAFIIAPTEIVEGDVQRIFYFHLPTALASYLCFAITCLFSIFFLWRKKQIYTHWAKASALVGVIFTIACLWSGMAWGKPIWGVWWTWDARLTSTLILLFLYTGYLLIHSLDPFSEGRIARLASVVGIISFLDIPLINMSVRWWRTLHPQPIVLAPLNENRLPSDMFAVLLISIFAIILFAIWLISINARIFKNEFLINMLSKKISTGSD
jgi:heme exporter protein C